MFRLPFSTLVSLPSPPPPLVSLYALLLARESFDLGCFTPFNTITSRCEFASRSLRRLCLRARSVSLSSTVLFQTLATSAPVEFISVMGQFRESLAICENLPPPTDRGRRVPRPIRDGGAELIKSGAFAGTREHSRRIARRRRIYARSDACMFCPLSPSPSSIQTWFPPDSGSPRDNHKETRYFPRPNGFTRGEKSTSRVSLGE